MQVLFLQINVKCLWTPEHNYTCLRNNINSNLTFCICFHPLINSSYLGPNVVKPIFLATLHLHPSLNDTQIFRTTINLRYNRYKKWICGLKFQWYFYVHCIQMWTISVFKFLYLFENTVSILSNKIVTICKSSFFFYLWCFAINKWEMSSSLVMDTC